MHRERTGFRSLTNGYSSPTDEDAALCPIFKKGLQRMDLSLSKVLVDLSLPKSIAGALE